MSDHPDDPFARIRDEAKSGGERRSRRPDDDGLALVQPAVGAPPLPRQFKTLGEPLAKWEYRDASGHVLRYVLRFPKPAPGEEGISRADWTDKEIRPATAWKDKAGRIRWRLAAEPGDSRPLYGLDSLAGRPGAAVLIVEGEKAADAASKILPDFVVVTWPGGSKGVGKADWAPLGGRDVKIWPDNDAPGIEAAEKVAAAALNANAVRVAVVILPHGLPPKWDLADPLPAGLSIDRLRDGLSAAKIRTREPDAAPFGEVTWPKGIRSDESGLWALNKDQGEVEAKPTWLCAPLKVLGQGRDAESGNWGVMLEFCDHDRQPKSLFVAYQDLAGEALEVRRRLLGEGLGINSSRSAKDRLLSAIMGVRTTRRLRLAYTTGWSEDQAAYVTPKAIIGRATDDQLVYVGPPRASYHGQNGSYAEWRARVADPARGNDLLIFGLACAFAGPLLRPLAAEGGGFHFRGGSSCGKTTLLTAAGSVWGGGGGGANGFVQTWRATPNAVESIAHAHNDGLLAFDEIKTAGPAAGEMAYALAGGQMKGRQGAAGALRDRVNWLVLILSTGEISLGDLIRQGSRAAGRTEAVYAGQELRLLDIAAEVRQVGDQWSAWQSIGSAESHAAFSDSLKKASKTHYGHAGPLFIEKLLEGDGAGFDQARRLAKAFVEDVCLADDTGQIRRGAERFAIVAAAAELAIQFDLVGWAPGDGARAVAAVFRRWARSFGRRRSREDQTALREVRGFISRHGHAQFRALREAGAEYASKDLEAGQTADEAEQHEAGRPRSMEEAGYWSTTDKHGKLFHFDPEFWRTRVFSSVDPAGAARALKSAGFLIVDGDGRRLTHKVRIPGVGPRSFYSVSQKILVDDSGDDDESD